MLLLLTVAARIDVNRVVGEMDETTL